MCIRHFHADCFERNLMSDLLTNHDWRKKKKLRPGAIPTMFKHKVHDMINLDDTTVSFKSSASQKRRSTLEGTEINYIFTSFYCFFVVSLVNFHFVRTK